MAPWVEKCSLGFKASLATLQVGMTCIGCTFGLLFKKTVASTWKMDISTARFWKPQHLLLGKIGSAHVYIKYLDLNIEDQIQVGLGLQINFL